MQVSVKFASLLETMIMIDGKSQCKSQRKRNSMNNQMITFSRVAVKAANSEDTIFIKVIKHNNNQQTA